MNVILSGFGAAADINKTRDELAKRYKDSVAYSATGMSKPEQIVRMVEDASRIFGQIDMLVNNAGILHTGPVSAEEALGHILGQVQPTRQYVTRRRSLVGGSSLGPNECTRDTETDQRQRKS